MTRHLGVQQVRKAGFKFGDISYSTVSFLSPKSHLGNVLVDMKLIDIKDTLPVGFIPIQETIDTRKLASLLPSCALGVAAPPEPVWWDGGGPCPRQRDARSTAALWGERTGLCPGRWCQGWWGLVVLAET